MNNCHSHSDLGNAKTYTILAMCMFIACISLLIKTSNPLTSMPLDVCLPSCVACYLLRALSYEFHAFFLFNIPVISMVKEYLVLGIYTESACMISSGL